MQFVVAKSIILVHFSQYSNIDIFLQKPLDNMLILIYNRDIKGKRKSRKPERI